MADSPPTQNCANCRYWLERWDDNPPHILGSCRRYPPTVLHSRDPEDVPEEGNSDGPKTYPGQWCGEWAPAAPETVTEGAATLARLVLLGDLTAARALCDKLKEEPSS